MAETLKLGNGIWGTKDGSLLSYNDESGNYKPLPFDFTRASSATVVNKAGLIETVQSGIPRIDFLGNTNGALLLEPQRTNLLPYSNDFSNGAWTKTSSTITSNQTISPDGDLTADLLTKTGANGYVRDDFTLSNGNTFSIYLKGNTSSFAMVAVGGQVIYIDLSDGTTAFGTPSPISFNVTVLKNGWFRLSATTSFVGYSSVRVFVADSLSSISGTSGSVYIYGAQLESSYPTSYIPTQGSTVTRVAEVCSQTPPSGIIGQTEGTLFADILYTSTNQHRFSITSGNNNWIFFSIPEINANSRVYIKTSGTIAVDSTTNLTNIFVVGQRYKIALGYKSGDWAIYINGTLHTSGTETFATANEVLSFYLTGTSASSINQINKTAYNQAQLYNTRLSNSELATLTTL